mgnify:FL=1
MCKFGAETWARKWKDREEESLKYDKTVKRRYLNIKLRHGENFFLQSNRPIKNINRILDFTRALWWSEKIDLQT